MDVGVSVGAPHKRVRGGTGVRTLRGGRPGQGRTEAPCGLNSSPKVPRPGDLRLPERGSAARLGTGCCQKRPRLFKAV